MKVEAMAGIRSIVSTMLVTGMLSGCATVPERNPVPEALQDSAQIPGAPGARHWADESPSDLQEWFDLTTDELRLLYPETFGEAHDYLALSGGGANGAFAAGLLNGWTVSGTRPRFTVVTGVSTGAIIAPFAFLGPDYDSVLKEIYTTFSTQDAAVLRNRLAALFGDAVADSWPMKDKLSSYIDDDLVAKLAVEFRKGRVLTIGTTNLDAGRPVSWNITRIAASHSPNRTQLIRDIILASASVPVAFPPVIFDVVVDGEIYDELHVDGAASSHVYFYPLGVDWAEVMTRMEVPDPPDLYVIRNGKLNSHWMAIKPKTLSIATRTFSTLSSKVSMGDMYRIYLAAQRDGLNYNLAYIPDTFTEKSTEPFDPAYMTKLFELGFELAKNGYDWKRVPPGYDGNND